MQFNVFRKVTLQSCRGLLAILLTLLLTPGDAAALALQQQTPADPSKPAAAVTTPAAGATTQAADVKIPPEQLDSLVAPIALYPDPLLSQVLVASTYPLEIVQLHQWLEKNKNLKDKKLVDAVAKQPWDPSIQGMAALPDVVKRLADEIQWTTDLGNAFLSQQADVMDAVQRMRKKAEDKGALKSNEQMKVETKVIENKSVIVVESAQPDVVYVPSYDPVVVYGPPVYPYPPMYYPYYGAGVVAASMISFGVGIAIGAAWGGWGFGCGWGNNDININMNNNFNRNSINNIGNRGNTNLGNRAGNNTWQHNPQHRGGAPYSNQRTADKFGGNRATAADRQAGARDQLGRQGGNLASRADGPGGGNLGGAGLSNRAGGSTGTGLADRAGGGAGAGLSDRAGGAGAGDRVGNRSTSPRSSGGSSFGGGSGGLSGSSARASSSRGSSSLGSSRAGGGGGARVGGGGGRVGGGGRRR
jgi:hypothetical protein